MQRKAKSKHLDKSWLFRNRRINWDHQGNRNVENSFRPDVPWNKQENPFSLLKVLKISNKSVFGVDQVLCQIASIAPGLSPIILVVTKVRTPRCLATKKRNKSNILSYLYLSATYSGQSV